MPYDVKKIDGKYCVVKTPDGDKKGCHATRGEAVEQLRALYASEAALTSNIEFNLGNIESAVEHLKLAAKLHMAHINGTAPTSPESQQELMGHINAALSALEVDEVESDDMHGDEDTEYMLRKKRYSYEGETEELATDLEEYAWEGPIVFENVTTGDNRVFKAGAIQWEAETLPWAFRWQKASGQGHAGSVPVGRVDRIERREDGTIFGYGVVIPGLSEEAAEYLRLLESGAGGGVSVDGDSAQFDVQEPATKDGAPRIEFSSMRLRALSAVDIPAFNGARIRLVKNQAVTASSGEEFAEEEAEGAEDEEKDSKCAKLPEALRAACEKKAAMAKKMAEKDSEEASSTTEEFAEAGVDCKSEGDAGCFPRSDYAYTPSDNVSEWKLRLTATPGGDPDSGIVGAAIAALGKGFRGNKVEIPAEDLDAVKAKVEAAWKAANPDKDEDEMPSFEAEVEELADEDCELCGEDKVFDPRQELAKRKKRNKKRTMKYGWKFDEALVASAVPTIPSTEYFLDPEFDGPTALTVTRDGRVFGHLALFNTCHIGFPGTCVKPPKGSDYRYFHTGEIETAEGETVAVGHLTFGTGHASMNGTAKGAAEHYDNTGTVAADVRCGEDEFGIWVVGALRPGMTEEQVREFRAAPLSGDWRKIAGRLELVGALAVNVPGFPVPRVRALVASGETEALFTFLEEDDEAFVPEEVLRADARADLEVRMGMVPKAFEAFDGRLEAREALATRLGIEFASDGGLDLLLNEDIKEEPPAYEDGKQIDLDVEDLKLPGSISKKQLQARSKQYENDLSLIKKDLPLLRELLDDPDEVISKKDREKLEQMYEIFEKIVDQPKGLTASAVMENVVEFYNQCNDPETGRFCEGPDGPGRVRDKGRGAARSRQGGYNNNRGRDNRGGGRGGRDNRGGDRQRNDRGEFRPSGYGQKGTAEYVPAGGPYKRSPKLTGDKGKPPGEQRAGSVRPSQPHVNIERYVDTYNTVRNHRRLARNWSVTSAMAGFLAAYAPSVPAAVAGGLGLGLLGSVPALTGLSLLGAYKMGSHLVKARRQSVALNKEVDFLNRYARQSQYLPERKDSF